MSNYNHAIGQFVEALPALRVGEKCGHVLTVTPRPNKPDLCSVKWTDGTVLESIPETYLWHDDTKRTHRAR